jgi:hypothetical protein
MMALRTEGEEGNKYGHRAVDVVAVIGHVDYVAGTGDFVEK